MPPQHDISTIQGVHGSGLTRVAFSRDGQKVFSAGHDTHVRIWDANGGPDQEGKVIDEHEDPVTCLDCTTDTLLTGCEDAAVRMFDIKSNIFTGFLTRTDAVAVRCIAVDPKGDRAVITSDETIFKIIKVSDPTEMVKTTGHTTSVLAASWDPKGVYLTTSGSDGKIMIWDLKHGEHPAQVKIMDIAPAVDMQSDDVCDITAVWHPNGKYFVLSTRTNELTCFSRETWAKTGTFTGEGHVGSITAVVFSPNGRYLATGGKDGQLIIWDADKRRVLEKMIPVNPPVPITCLAWSPTANLLAFTDNEGSFRRWLNPVKSTLPDPFSAPPEKAREVTSVRPERERAPVVTEEKTFDDDGLFGDDFDMADFEKEQEEMGEDLDEPVYDKHGPAKQMVAVTPAQPPFQPGSTPMKDNKRYLAWNLLGLIQSIDQGSYNYINVEFFDKTMRTGDRFQDYNNFTMASLGERGALYACPSEGTTRSIIDYRPYRQASWAPDTRWRYELPKGEEVIAIAAGGPRLEKRDEDEGGADDGAGCGNVVVATSKGYVRFFSGSGVQDFIWSAGADIVAVAAGEEWAFIVYRDGGVSLDGCQNLRYTLISFDTYEHIQEGRVPLMKRITLQWMGISENGSPVIYDSAGVLHALQYYRRPSKGMWVPVLDTNLLERRINKQESYWPVGVSETEFHCVILKGLEEYPSPNKPPVTEHKLQLPLLGMEKNDKGEVGDGVHEDKIIRSRTRIAALRDALVDDEDDPEEIPALELEVDKALVWLIGKACLANKVQRAYDLCRKLQRLPSFDAAVQPARRYHHKGLEQRILALKQEFQDRDPLDDHRAQRQKWKLDASPVEPTVPHHTDPWAKSGPPPFDVLPPPAKDRSFLAPAVPTVVRPFQDTNLAPTMSSTTVRSRETSYVPETQPARDDDDSMDIEWPPSPPANGKRKRTESQATEEDGGEDDSPPIKKRVSEEQTEAPPAAKPKSFNPFARKPTTTGTSLGSNNPFLRQKSFAPAAPTPTAAPAVAQLVKAPRAKKSDAAPRQKPEPQGRQLTLSSHFGVPPPPPPPPPPAKKPRGRQSKKDKDSETLETVPEDQTQSDSYDVAKESQQETQVDIPANDVTQPVEESQNAETAQLETQAQSANDTSANEPTQGAEISQVSPPAEEVRPAEDRPAVEEIMPTEEQQGMDVSDEDVAVAKQVAEVPIHKMLPPHSPGLSDKENRDKNTSHMSPNKSATPADAPTSGSGVSKLAAYKMPTPKPVVLTEAVQ